MEWDQGIHPLLFAVQESIQESLGISPFELVFGHTLRGPLKENWLAVEPATSLLDQVSDLRLRLKSACELTQKNMNIAENRMKIWYDKKYSNVGRRESFSIPPTTQTAFAS